jgi:PleD family two-component response regulator
MPIARLARDLGDGAAVVIVDPSPPRRRRLASRLARHGLSPLEAPAPLDAVQALERTTARAVVVAPTLTQTDPTELARYVSEAYPSVRVIQL